MTTFIPNQDGFTVVDKDSAQLTYNNVSLLRNQISPFYVENSDLNFDAQGIAIDTYYGLGYDTNIKYPMGIYGCETKIPNYSGDSLSNYGFLRTPFRKIPRILVHSRYELNTLLNSITSADIKLNRLFRGQLKEYFLNRNPSTLSLLYNDPHALEPSLIPSASRAGINLEDIGNEWSSLVQLFIHLWVSNLDSSQVTQKAKETINQQVNHLKSSYNLWIFLASLAQHYGLPSVGLDVTSNIETALFFALNDISISPSNPHKAIVKRRSTTGSPSVIYYFVSKEGFYIDWSGIRPYGFPSARPDAQTAYFLHTGWGEASNAIANNLFMAIYLDPAGDWGHLPTVKELFPNPVEDPFGRFLEDNLNKGSIFFQKFTEKFYWAYDE